MAGRNTAAAALWLTTSNLGVLCAKEAQSSELGHGGVEHAQELAAAVTSEEALQRGGATRRASQRAVRGSRRAAAALRAVAEAQRVQEVDLWSM